MPVLYLGKRPVPYRVVIRPRRRHPALQVRQGELLVLLPPGWGAAPVEAWVARHRRWVERHLSPEQAAQREWQTGEVLRYLGVPLTLEIVPSPTGHPSSVDRLGERLVAMVGPGDDTRALVGDWYRGAATDWIFQRLGDYAPRFGAQVGTVWIRDYKSRWGFCRADGVLAFNWRLIQAPEAVADYIIIHELAHLRHLNHQHAFWQLVALHCPHYQEQRRWLNREGRTLYW